MQVLCGLQVVFFLFNCQTPGNFQVCINFPFIFLQFNDSDLALLRQYCKYIIKFAKGKESSSTNRALSCKISSLTHSKKKALQPLKTRACSALWSVHEI